MPTVWLDLPAPPVLPGLFLHTALCHSIRDKALSERGLCSQVMVDPKHLERYHQICGFCDDDLLPPIYPHILTFPLQMALLIDKRFPFPLLGLIRLENRIDMLRAPGGLGSFTVGVAIENLQPHDKGATFSIVTRLKDQLGLLWIGDSRVLCRDVEVPGEIPLRAEQELLPLEPVDSRKASADISRRYARAVGGYDPIRPSAPSAKLFGFPRTIVYDLWSKVRSLAALSEQLPASDYWVKVRFQKPMLLPANLTSLTSAAAADDQFSLRGKDDLPHMAGHWNRLQGWHRSVTLWSFGRKTQNYAATYRHREESPIDLHELTACLHVIRDRNDWCQFHSPKNLAMATSVEMTGLVEIFRQLTEDQSHTLPAEQSEHAGQKAGDIVLYLLLFCGETGLDLEQVIHAKLTSCERCSLP